MKVLECMTPRGSGGGRVRALSCMGYIGMCSLKRYRFSAVINRLSILADFGHLGHK